MGEILPDKIERLGLDELKEGDTVAIATGIGEEEFMYVFVVEKPGQWPEGQLEEIRPDGMRVGPRPFQVHGSGRWTTMEENPVQKEMRAFTSYFDSINLGSFLVIADPEASTDGGVGRLVFDKPGQEISNIVVEKAEVSY